MKVKNLIQQLTTNADPEADVHIDCEQGTVVMTNIMLSAACDEDSSVKAGDIILMSFAPTEE